MNRLLALLAAVSLPSVAFATVITTGQLAVPLTIPGSLAQDTYESTSLFWVIPELRGVTLPVGLPGGTFAAPIPAGTRVDVYLIHSDPATAEARFRGTATFDAPILGFYPGSAALNASDALLMALGSSIAAYPTGATNRGLEVGCQGCLDQFSFSNGNRTISLSLNTGTYMDEARIIVAAPVPEPGSLALLLAPAALLAARRWRGRTNRPRMNADKDNTNF